jgi:hypothetical protein
MRYPTYACGGLVVGCGLRHPAVTCVLVNEHEDTVQMANNPAPGFELYLSDWRRNEVGWTGEIDNV